MAEQCREGSIMSKGKVTEQETWIMKGMYSDGISTKEIAKQLSRTQLTVEKHLDVKEQDLEVTEEPVKQHNKNDTTMFVRSSIAKNNNGVTIMTDAESSRSDFTRDKRQSTIGSKLQSNIHKISEEDG